MVRIIVAILGVLWSAAAWTQPACDPRQTGAAACQKPPPAPSAAPFHSDQTASGILTPGYHNQIVYADNAPLSDPDGQYDAWAFLSQWSGPGASLTGARNGMLVKGIFVAPSGSGNTNRNYNALLPAIEVQSGDGGTAMNADQARGAFFATNPYCQANAGATFLLELTCGEIDIRAQKGSSMYYKTGLSIGGTPDDAVAGALYDDMLSFSDQVGAIGHLAGIDFTAANGQFPIGPPGNLIIAHGPARTDKRTHLTANAPAGATSLTVEFAGGFSAGQVITVIEDNRKRLYTRVDGAPSGKTIAIAPGLDFAASAGTDVFASGPPHVGGFADFSEIDMDTFASCPRNGCVFRGHADILSTTDTGYSTYGPSGLVVATEGGRSGIVGYMLDNAVAGTHQQPAGVNGQAIIITAGNQGFGVRGVAELRAPVGAAAGGAFITRNHCGPPAGPNGAARCVTNGLEVHAGGQYESANGLVIGTEAGASGGFHRAIYLKPDYGAEGVHVAAPPSGIQTGVTVENNGNGTNVVLTTTGAAHPNNAMLELRAAGGTKAASIRQNGDIYGRTVALKTQSSAPAMCNAAFDGQIALTTRYTTCVCKGGASTWVSTNDGTTACAW